MEIHQVLPTIDSGDAIGNYALTMRQILRKNGFKSEIYAENMEKGLENIKNYKQLHNTKGLLIYHFSIGSDANEFVNSLPNKKILIYHNITPPNYFIGYNDQIAHLCGIGLNQIKKFKNNVILAIGDSEYNKKELEELGFSNVSVVYPIIDFSRLNEFNKNIYKKFNDGKVNILFVGRIVPNKKFDDLIKVFYYYNNYINSDSRLILVGSHSGMMPYYEYLTRLVKKLRLEGKVIFTGKVSNADLSAYYRVATNFLCMSEHEGFCIPLLEAMFFKIPIIAYNSTAVPSTLGDAGILINKKNYEEIAELMNVINSNTSLRNKIIRSENKRLKEFDKKKIGRKFIKILEDSL